MFFDLSWSHILILLIVTLVVVGPKDLPKMMRQVGRWTGKARAMANQLRKSFDEMARQSELDELRAEIQALRNHQPLADVAHELNKPIIPEAYPMAAKPVTAAEKPDHPEAASAAPVEPVAKAEP
jgi:sec-independent protein translocase protein TatB